SVGTGGGTLDDSGSGILNWANPGSIDFNGQSGPRTLTLTGSGTALLAAAISDNSGATALAKTGNGTCTLGTATTYSATPTVSGGTLKDGSINALPTGTTLTISGTGTVDLNGFAQTVGGLAGDSNSHLTNFRPALVTFTDNTGGTDTFAGTVVGALNL